jgi:segregation and condensation protein B
MTNDIEKKIEAVLFWKGEPMSLKKLGEILKVSEGEIKDAVFNLKNNLAGRGVVLLENSGEITLGTAPELSKLIENLQKEELNKELSRASLETLSIILYKNGISRAEIDYIRGVNSSFILRALSVRGLIEKTLDPKDNRRFLYRPSFDLFSFMGVKSVEELPNWGEVNSSINVAIKNLEEETAKEEGVI